MHTDHLDTPRVLTDASGVVVWQAESGAYGTGAPDEDPDGDLTALSFSLRFPGQYYDAETGLHYNRFRYYDPEVGRYISGDPIGQLGGVNLYTYALNNPANWFDFFGLDSFLVARPTDTRVPGSVPGIGGDPVADHLFVATGADYPGDPNADIISYAQGDDGNIEQRLNGPTDTAAWLGLAPDPCEGQQGSGDTPYSQIPASDADVAAAAAAAAASGDYAALGAPFGTNSNAPAQAIANQAAGQPVPTPSTGKSVFGPHGAGDASRVPFR